MRDANTSSTLSKIPLDWKSRRFDSIGEITSSKRIHRSDYINEGIPFFRGKEITQLSKGEALNDLVYISEKKFNQLKNKFGAPIHGDILITSVGTIGSVYLVKEKDKFYFKDGNLIWIRHIEKDTNREYLSHYLKSLIFQKLIDDISSGSSQKALTIVKLKNLPLALPPLPEQQKIAEILSTVDEKIEAIDQRIAETQELKKGLMQQLLTKGIGHTKFKDSPLGKIPESWEVKELGQLSSIKGRIGYRGYTKADLVTEGEGALTIGAKHIDKNSQLNFSEPVFINWEKYEESPEIKVSLGDLLMVQRGTLGKIALVKELPFPATINPSMVLIKELKCNDSYLFYYLCSNNIQDIIYQISTATAVPMISQKQINSFKIALPNLKEQQKISDILSSVDDKLQIQQDKKTEYQELKKGLMQQLLTGKIRVKI